MTREALLQGGAVSFTLADPRHLPGQADPAEVTLHDNWADSLVFTCKLKGLQLMNINV